jgi:hypothetical protein
MRSPSLAWLAGASLVAVVALLPSLADASWPLARHDARRSGAATGKSDLVKPVPYFRTYLGGSLSGAQLAEADVDGDGRLDLLFASSGRIVAKRNDDSGIWQTKPYGVGSISAITDLDGDGKLDVVASASNKVLIFALATGLLEWEEPDGEMGILGRALVADANGDGKADVVSFECGCCGVNSGKTGFVRSFATGFQNPTLLWTMPAVACGAGRSLAFVDVDGNGSNELVVGLYDHFEVYRGSDGALLAKSPTLGTWISVSNCWAGNLDATPGNELACVLTSSDAPGTDQRKLFVLKYDGTPTLKSPWKVALAPDATGDVAIVNPIADLDGDGTNELVASGYDPNAGGWRTRILDAATGADLVPAITGHKLAGVAAMEDKTKRIFVTAAGSNVLGWSFARTPTPTVTQRWQVADRSVVTTLDAKAFAVGGYTVAALARDTDGDALEDLILRSTKTPTLYAMGAPGGVTKDIGSITLTGGANVLSVWSLPAKDLTGPQFALARTDGVLDLLDARLGPATTGGEFPRKLSLRVGGYYASGAWRELRNAPRSIAFKQGDPDAIVVADSRGALVRFDPKTASWAIPPVPTWEKLDHAAPSLVPGLDGTNAGVACLKHVADDWSVAVLKGDGTEIWSKPIERFPLGDLVPGKINADSTPDLVVQWGDPSDVILRTRALSGLDGAKLWDATPVSPGAGRQPAGVSVGAWNGDGLDDVFMQGPSTLVLSGANGAQLTSGGTGDSYFLPTLVDTNSDGTDEVLLHGGFSPVRLYDHTLTTALWSSSDDDRPYPYGAIATCPSGPVLVEGSLQFPSRVKITPLSGGTLGQFSTQVLANGQSYANETAAKNAGAFLGQLTSAAVHANLTGKGRPTAVLGSSDGYLYALNPCDGALDFVVSLKVAVGEATFADTDGDGRDEILVTAADGYLYGLKNENIASPASVTDSDPENPGPNDVDLIYATDRLAGRWTAVPNATAYEVTAVTEDGKAVAPWKNVGTATDATIGGLTLTLGARYTFAVRALSAAGPSVDVVSNGVTVSPRPGDGGPSGDAGPDGGGESPGDGSGCGCHVAGVDGGSARGALASAGALGLALLLLGRRKRR